MVSFILSRSGSVYYDLSLDVTYNSIGTTAVMISDLEEAIAGATDMNVLRSVSVTSTSGKTLTLLCEYLCCQSVILILRRPPRLVFAGTVRSRYIPVTFIQITPIARQLGRGMGGFREFEVWPKFYLRSCALCTILL